MILLRITGIRDFMGKLLLKDVFDGFLLSEASITTYNSFHIDGRLYPDFYASDTEKKESIDGREYSLWGEVRPVCRDLIKGRNTPLSFQFVLRFPDTDAENLISRDCPGITPSDVDGLFINIKFSSDNLSVTTGTSLNIFTTDKSLDKAWDEYVKTFLAAHSLAFEE